MKAAVLLSGGMDSCTVLAQALVDGATEIHAISYDYGSLHGKRELLAAETIVAYYHDLGNVNIHINQTNPFTVEHGVVKLPGIFVGGHSALMGDVPMPHEEYKDWMNSPWRVEGPSSTVVPFRNANFISVAATICERDGLDTIYAGMHATDAHGWAYPDCTPEFLGAMANAVFVGTMFKVRLRFPFIWMSKSDVVTRAAMLEAPLEMTWSCYKGGKYHCGTCPTCLERIRAFKQAGFADPVQYDPPVDFGGLEVFNDSEYSEV